MGSMAWRTSTVDTLFGANNPYMAWANGGTGAHTQQGAPPPQPTPALQAQAPATTAPIKSLFG